MVDDPYRTPQNDEPLHASLVAIDWMATVSQMIASSLLPLHVATNIPLLLRKGDWPLDDLIYGHWLMPGLALLSIGFGLPVVRRQRRALAWLIPMALYLLLFVVLRFFQDEFVRRMASAS